MGHGYFPLNFKGEACFFLIRRYREPTGSVVAAPALCSLLSVFYDLTEGERCFCIVNLRDKGRFEVPRGRQ